MAAHEQNKFWEYHDKLFENTKALSRADLDKHAEAVGLDMAKFKQALDTNKFKRLVEADTRLGQTVGVRGTPHFFINGRPLSGAQPKDKFAAIIKEEIAAADKLIAAGTPVARVYTELMRNAKASPTAGAPGAAGAGAQGARPGMPDPNAVYKVAVGESPRKGGRTPKVTIVEFSDFQ
jgi:protein-disulfide isomerase